MFSCTLIFHCCSECDNICNFIQVMLTAVPCWIFEIRPQSGFKSILWTCKLHILKTEDLEQVCDAACLFTGKKQKEKGEQSPLLCMYAPQTDQ